MMKDVIAILPEIFLGATLVAVILGEVTYHGERVRLISPIALLGLVVTLFQIMLTFRFGQVQVFNHSMAIDGISLFFKMLFVLLAGLSLVASTHTSEISESRRSEYAALILASTLAMCLVASAADLLLAFMSLQFMNVLAYFLASYSKRSILSTEAAVKFMAFCAVGGALFLYGLAILFGSTHSLNMYEIHRALVASPFSRETGLVVFMLLFMSLCFQVAAFPMYLWAPDVLEGSPTPVSAFLSVGTRAAGFALALRVFVVIFAQPSLSPGEWQVLGALDWTRIVALVSGLTMSIGSLLAYRQVTAKRMVGYLVVAESGFLLMGLLVLDEIGVAALLFNLFIELFALIGIFYVLSFFYDETGSVKFSDLRGMLKRAVPECICLILFLICLVGLPPMPGFIGKFTLINVAVHHHWSLLAAVAILSMVLSALAVAQLAYHLVGDFRKPRGEPLRPNLRRKGFLLALTLPMVLTGIFAEFMLNWAGRSLGFILW